MAQNKNKIKVSDTWAEKFLREQPFMAFGSLCNFLGQAYQGKGISEKELEKLARKSFELAMEFAEKAYERIEKIEKEQSNFDFPEK